MVSTRHRREPEEERDPPPQTVAAAASDDSSDDDDAPEEVSLATGKQSAEQRRRDEAAAEAAARAAAKEKRAAQLERQRAAKAERQAAAAAAAAAEKAAADGEGEEDDDEEGGDDEGEEEREGLDLLPDDVLAALASNKRTVPTAHQARLISERLRRQQEAAAAGEPLLVLGQPARKEITELDVGPVVVQVLGAQGSSKPSQSARDFLQQRLHAGVKRSADMLKPARAFQPAHIAARRTAQPLPAAAAAPQPKRRW